MIAVVVARGVFPAKGERDAVQEFTPLMKDPKKESRVALPRKGGNVDLEASRKRRKWAYGVFPTCKPQIPKANLLIKGKRETGNTA